MISGPESTIPPKSPVSSARPLSILQEHAPMLLVVDDELGYREGIRRLLAGRGYKVQAAAGGVEALALATGQDFPIVLVDLKMPGMDGFELIDKLRKARPKTLCIVVSAFATIESAVQTTKMGAFDFVVKPFLPDDLLLVVTRAVESWLLGQEADRLRSEREAHLLQLTQEKSRLRTILQSMGDGLLVVNIDGDVVLDNPVARRLLGRLKGPGAAGPVGLYLHDERVLEEVSKMLQGQGDEVTVSLEVTIPPEAAASSGDERYLRVTLAPVRDEKGALLGVVVLLADITDAKAFEKMKTFFVSMVAHELKAPIGAVEGYLNMILAGALDGDPARLKKTVARCLARTGALLSLIQDLLEITRRQSGKQERRIEAIDMHELVTNLLEFHRHDADQRHISASFQADCSNCAVMADRGDMERVVTNLISNAIKYNRDNGTIDVRLCPEGTMVRLSVHDTGIGMAPDEVARLGQEFFRAKNANTRMITGTGLGVALLKKIVESYNGALEVRSVPEQGSTFSVLLPAQPSEALRA